MYIKFLEKRAAAYYMSESRSIFKRRPSSRAVTELSYQKILMEKKNIFFSSRRIECFRNFGLVLHNIVIKGNWI